MRAFLISGPAAEPISVMRLREHLRLGGGEDALLSGLIVAARMTVEAQSGMRLISQQWRMAIDNWRQSPLNLPVAPVQAIKSVEVLNTPINRLAASDYRLDTAQQPAQLSFIGNHLPLPDRPTGGIHITMSVGFGDAEDDVPQDLQLAVLQLAAHWYDVDDWAQCRGARAVPPHITGIVVAYRVPRL